MISTHESRRASIIAILVALAVASNYALLGVPNVKLMDFIVFVSGFCFGSFVGVLVGLLIWMVYGALNPYGFVFSIWLATMFSETIYGLVGGVLGRKISSANFNDLHLELSILFGVVGFLLTLIYDLITNLVYAFTYNVPIVAVLVFGVTFTILHELSNALIFGIGSIPVIAVLEKMLGGDRSGVSAK